MRSAVGEVVRFPIEKRVPIHGLNSAECGAVYTAACLLIAQGQATAVSIENDGQYVCIFDRHREPYFFGRVDRQCCLFDHETRLIVQSVSFEVVLDAIQTTLVRRQSLNQARRFSNHRVN